MWAHVWDTPDGRQGGASGPELEPGEGWSYQLEPSPEPARYRPVARWDLPPAPGDGLEGRELEEGDPVPPGRPRYCGGLTVAGRLPETDRLGFCRLLCRRWDCPTCGPERGRAVRKAMLEASLVHGLVRLVTLTLDPAKVQASGIEPHAYIKQCFNRLRYRWQKAYRKGVEYIAVVEHHRSGMPHLHLLVSRFIPQKALKRWWQTAGGGFEVRISYRDPGRAGRYIAKYVAKALYAELRGEESFPERARRWQTSRGIRLFPAREPRPEEDRWRLVRCSIDAVAAAACVLRETLDGLEVEVHRAGRWLRFLTLPEAVWWQVSFILGVPDAFLHADNRAAQGDSACRA